MFHNTMNIQLSVQFEYRNKRYALFLRSSIQLYNRLHDIENKFDLRKTGTITKYLSYQYVNYVVKIIILSSDSRIILQG